MERWTINNINILLERCSLAAAYTLLERRMTFENAFIISSRVSDWATKRFQMERYKSSTFSSLSTVLVCRHKHQMERLNLPGRVHIILQYYISSTVYRTSKWQGPSWRAEPPCKDLEFNSYSRMRNIVLGGWKVLRLGLWLPMTLNCL